MLTSSHCSRIERFSTSFVSLSAEDTSPFRGVTDTPVLDFWWCLLLVSKPGWIPYLHAFSPACNKFPRFTSSATPANLLLASMAAEDARIRPRDLMHSKQTRYPLSHRSRLTNIKIFLVTQCGRIMSHHLKRKLHIFWIVDWKETNSIKKVTSKSAFESKCQQDRKK